MDSLVAIPPPLPPVMSGARASALLGGSRDTAYALARSGQLPGVTKLGPRLVVRTAVRWRWLDGQPTAQ